MIPNGVDLAAFQPGPARRRRCERGSARRTSFVVLYCGAHGISHALGRDPRSGRARCGGDARIHFLFVGEGAEKDGLVARARALGLANVTFLPGRAARARSPALYRSADVCLVPLRAVPLFRAFIPSKMFEILACGRPILASLEGEAAAILRDSGAAVVVPPEDVEALVGRGRRLAARPRPARQLAARGRAYVAAHFDRRRARRALPRDPGRRDSGRAAARRYNRGPAASEASRSSLARQPRRLKVLHVVGARPNFMKMAPVMRALAARAGRVRAAPRPHRAALRRAHVAGVLRRARDRRRPT